MPGEGPAQTQEVQGRSFNANESAGPRRRPSRRWLTGLQAGSVVGVVCAADRRIGGGDFSQLLPLHERRGCIGLARRALRLLGSVWPLLQVPIPPVRRTGERPCATDIMPALPGLATVPSWPHPCPASAGGRLNVDKPVSARS